MGKLDSFIDLRTCLDRRFHFDGSAYSWQSTAGKFEVRVNIATTGTGNNVVHVHMRDLLSDLLVEDWSTTVRCTDDWRDRLQEQVGKALIRAQHRPSCTRCFQSAGERVPMLVKNPTSNKKQFFGCSRFREFDCHYTLDLDKAFDPLSDSTHVYSHSSPSRALPGTEGASTPTISINQSRS